MDTTKHWPVKSTNVATIPDDKLYCVECDKRFSGSSALSKHKKAVHEGVIYECIQCDYKATQKANLKLHIESIHEGMKRFQCKFCNYRCDRKFNLQSHIKNNH